MMCLIGHNPWQTVLDDEEEESYQKIISANRGTLLSQMIEENIDKIYARDSIDMLDYGYPLFNHKTSYQLAELMGMMQKFELDLTQFDDSTAFDNKINTAVEVLAKERLKHSKSFLSLKEKFGVSGNDNDLALEKQFILHWLELTRRRQRTDDLHAFINAAKPSEFAEECFLLSFFSSNKEKLKQENPAQATWLESLTDEQIIDLMSAVNKASPNGVGKMNDFMQQLLLQAMELGFTAHLSFENMHFVNKDLRAFDFSGVSLNNVSFESCLLPLAGSNIQCHNVKMLDCYLPGTDDSTTSDDYALLFQRLCSDRNYVSSSLVIQFLLAQISEQSLISHDKYDPTALMWASRNDHIDIVKAMLASDKCSQRVLEQADKYGYTTLIVAVKWGHTEIVKAILASNKCSRKCVEQQTNRWGDTALTKAAKKGHTEIVKAILASNECSQKYVEQTNKCGDTALIIAVKWGRTSIVKAILASDKCSQEYIEYSNRWGDTALSRAASRGCTETVKAILASGKCSLNSLKHARQDWLTLDLDVPDNRSEIVEHIDREASYQAIWESAEGGEGEKALAVLSDYCKGTTPVLSSLSLFAHGHINRHHTDTVRHLLKEHERGHVDWPEIVATLKYLKLNQDGSLACRLRFIESRLQKEEAEEESQSPRPPGL